MDYPHVQLWDYDWHQSFGPNSAQTVPPGGNADTVVTSAGAPSKSHRYTSSTAQAGGGSFRNRKPTGRVGCCDSRMAERIH